MIQLVEVVMQCSQRHEGMGGRVIEEGATVLVSDA
jgi:hypothetical protein